VVGYHILRVRFLLVQGANTYTSPVSQTNFTTRFAKGETFAFVRPRVVWLMKRPGHDYDLAWQLTNAMMDTGLLSLDNHVVVYSDWTLVGCFSFCGFTLAISRHKAVDALLYVRVFVLYKISLFAHDHPLKGVFELVCYFSTTYRPNRVECACVCVMYHFARVYNQGRV
jgi:hypothetical protein